ncbi:MAG: Gfo/Idh/MocA family oxidoreductase [Armatimonadetes bacterium]|nr:Gfo/Idh/MocA family oxidoreductase [Armatimonadota bacterium]
MNQSSRRQFLASASALGAASLVPKELLAFNRVQGELPGPKSFEYKALVSPVTAIICGYGGRGGYYGSMQAQLPGEWKVVGVAEPIDYRNEAAARIHNLPDGLRFSTWEHVFDRPKFADVVVISMPDNLHYKPTLRALEMGYDVLLEKPIAQTWRQCQDILELANKKGRIVGVCHVLRYAPYFVQMHAAISQGVIGDVVSIQHLEPIHYLHFAHSFVRGPWHNSRASNPSLLSKSCHDLDIIRWLVGKPCTRVSSLGGLRWFRKENAPKGAPRMCLAGCPHEATCIYHAGRVYVKEKLWSTHHIISRDRSDQAILEQLRKVHIGRCVFQADNDVADHQLVNMEFAGGATAAFSMEAMTSYAGRRTRVMGTKGDIVGDENVLDVFDFENRTRIQWDVNRHYRDLSGHGGGDLRLVRDFTQAVARHDPNLLSSNLGESMESHLIGFQAERSRLGDGRALRVVSG